MGFQKQSIKRFVNRTAQMVLDELVADAGLKLNMGKHQLPTT